MNLRITGLGSRFRSRADSFTHSFGSVLALLVLAYWYGEAYGTERWLALPLIAMSFLSIIVALRIVNPVRVHRHLGVTAVATALAAIAALIDSQTLMSAPLLLVLFYSCYAFAVILPYVFTRHRVTANVILGAVCV
jgi:hypothetical protein